MTAVTLFHAETARQDGGLRALLAFARPFILLAGLAFFAGFGGYLILGPPQVMAGAHHARPAAPDAFATPANDGVMPDWNPPRQI